MDWQMHKTCAECPWLLSSPPGKFPPERYYELADTCKPGGMPGNVFACHMTPDGRERACAGMLIVTRDDLPNRLRLMVAWGQVDPEACEASGPLYPSYRALAAANYCDPEDEALNGLP